MYGLFGKMRTRPGKRDELIALMLKGMVEMAGCHVYTLNADPTDPDGVWVYEVWRSKEDWAASLTLETVQAVIASARPLIAGFGERYELTPIGGKGPPEEP